jgi:hypothetical protein
MWHLSLSHTFTMPSAAFCNKPLSTSVNSLSENLGVTLNWILLNGIQALLVTLFAPVRLRSWLRLIILLLPDPST